MSGGEEVPNTPLSPVLPHRHQRTLLTASMTELPKSTKQYQSTTRGDGCQRLGHMMVVAVKSEGPLGWNGSVNKLPRASG
jgi:hypothetical protein